MEEQSTIKIKKPLSWEILGVLATLVLGVPGLYFAFHEKSPNVAYEMESSSNVLDIHRPLPDLKILFKESDLQDHKKNLKVITFSLVNRGDQDVIQSGYDQDQPFGLRFRNAEIVGEPRIIYSNSIYLKQNLFPKVTSPDSIEFNKVILERGKLAKVEVLIIHDVDSVPIASSYGKIAGQEDIKVIDVREEHVQGFWGTVTYGGILVNIARLVISSVIFVVILAALSLGMSKYSDRQMIKMKEKGRDFLAPVVRDLDFDTSDALFAIIDAVGEDVVDLETCYKVLSDPNEVNLLIENYQKYSETENLRQELIRRAESMYRSYDANNIEEFEQDESIRKNLITIGGQVFAKTDDSLAVKESLIVGLKRLVQYLKRQPPAKSISLRGLRNWDEIRKRQA